MVCLVLVLLVPLVVVFGYAWAPITVRVRSRQWPNK